GGDFAFEMALTAFPHVRRHIGKSCREDFGVHVTLAALETTHVCKSALPGGPPEIGGIPILLRPSHPEFCQVLENRYACFLNPDSTPVHSFEIELDPIGRLSDEDARVFLQGSRWCFERGDFRATWDRRA